MTISKNVLSSDVEIKGSIKFSHDLIIDGRIEGEVSSDGALTVGENALIKGEIKTRAVTLFGKVEGNITVVERCELKSAAVLVGDVTAGTLAIEEGATFLGRSQVGKGAAAAKPASRSPYDHSSSGLPIGILPWSYSAKSASLHFSSITSTGGGGAPRPPAGAGGAGGRPQ